MLVPSEPGVFLWTDAMLTAERARELLSYDPETGWLTWLITRGKAKIGNRAGSVSVYPCGYKNRQISVDGKCYREHRVIWLIVTGEWPLIEIDHEDHDGTNNIFSNLKQKTRKQNGRNRKINSDNKTGITGVSWNRFRSRFVACIRVNGKLIHLGNFRTIDAASESRRAADAIYGFHKNHGK